jgi:hypothetical protein
MWKENNILSDELKIIDTEPDPVVFNAMHRIIDHCVYFVIWGAVE